MDAVTRMNRLSYRAVWISDVHLGSKACKVGYLLTWLGDAGYEVLIKLNRWLNIARKLLKRPYWSLSAYLKSRVKKARQHICNYESAVIDEARRWGMDGVICGHIHHPDLYTEDGILYCNDGDWVENCCSVVETHDGHFHLLNCTEQMEMIKSSKAQALASAI